ncbi:hypothetical protein [Actinoplanes lobatus]|uniref:Uncharacterized protein n=1 Tax=Actinoplanes lobatus TaxID=113568 RepID=A0A7W7MJ05_9ACTN|nr:hypothetical protein [Actinoplanes lobatus]MBB4751891.1 hypothetical protein [Actinoplanes lobatus]
MRYLRLRMQLAAIESMGDVLDSEDDPEPDSEADNDSGDPAQS